MNKYIMRRGWMDDEIFRQERYTEREAFEYLISEAAWRDRIVNRLGKRISLQCGQLAHSVRRLSEKWRWDKSKVSRFLNKLENAGKIFKQTETGIMVITICGYEGSQEFEEGCKTRAGARRGLRARRIRDKEEHQTTPDNTLNGKPRSGIAHGLWKEPKRLGDILQNLGKMDS